jgi:hypothetical protein
MKRSLLLVPILLLGCEPRSPTDDHPGPHVSEPHAPGPRPDAALPERPACPPMFGQDIVPEYHVQIADAEWAALVDEFLNRADRLAAGLEEHPYHPVELEYVVGGERERPAAPVMLRLKGQSSWRHAVALDDPPKMQFVVAFNEVDRRGRFHGVRKIELDMPRNDRTYLKQRVALSYLREAGVAAQCANNARLYINGAYYGLYTNLERLDKEFLERVFPDADHGDLWKNGRRIRTNKDTYDDARISALWEVSDVRGFADLADLDASVYAWAAEAMVGAADGYYNGSQNFFVYDHPHRGFVWIPHDVDTALDPGHLPFDTTPVIPPRRQRNERYWHHYLLVMLDPTAIEGYVQALGVARSHYDATALQDRLDAWAAQIADAAAEDPHRPFTLETHARALTRMREYIAARATYLDAWLACRTHGGVDADGDGVDMCHDCNDRNPGVYPGAVEACDGLDTNCDGRIDRTGDAPVCE